MRTFYCLERGKAVHGETIDPPNCFGRDAITGASSFAGLGIRSAETLAERLITAAIREDI